MMEQAIWKKEGCYILIIIIILATTNETKKTHTLIYRLQKHTGTCVILIL